MGWVFMIKGEFVIYYFCISVDIEFFCGFEIVNRIMYMCEVIWVFVSSGNYDDKCVSRIVFIEFYSVYFLIKYWIVIICVFDYDLNVGLCNWFIIGDFNIKVIYFVLFNVSLFGDG